MRFTLILLKAAAKERGHRAAIALRVAKSSSNRPPPTPGFEEGKADHCRRGQAQNADKEQNRPSPPLSADARRRRQKAQERANAARLVLGIGKRAPPTPPRKASHRDIGGGRGEAAARGGVSTPSSSPMGGADAKIRDRTRSDGSIPALSGVKNSGPGKEKKVSSPPFCSPAVQDVPPPPPSENGQHILRRAQSARCGGTDDESRRLVERVVAAPGGSSLERRRWASGGEDKAGGVKVADSDPMGTAGPDLARRRQAANAVFGLGFKSDREGIVSSVRAEEKEVALEVTGFPSSLHEILTFFRIFNVQDKRRDFHKDYCECFGWSCTESHRKHFSQLAADLHSVFAMVVGTTSACALRILACLSVPP